MENKKDNKKTAAVVVGILLLFFYFRYAGTSGCSKKIVDLATRCEMYSTDHSGVYPPSLGEIGNGFCPGSFYNCISYESTRNPDRFIIRCSGGHWQRRGFREGFPYYDSSGGWRLGPDTWSTLPPHEYLSLHSNPKL